MSGSNSRGQGVLKYELLLLLVSMIWGSAFVAQQIGMKKGLGPMTFIGLRFMSLEAVFAALAGYLVLNQILTGRAIIGCFLILAGVLMVQLVPLMLGSAGQTTVKAA
jgi:drug/metabolite transporter (DMT)-like permease